MPKYNNNHQSLYSINDYCIDFNPVRDFRPVEIA